MAAQSEAAFFPMVSIGAELCHCLYLCPEKLLNGQIKEAENSH